MLHRLFPTLSLVLIAAGTPFAARWMKRAEAMNSATIIGAD
ncbi:MAG: hypothetical protein VCE75_08185 [Alphaproteobacteria bacterium]|jgi:hypothetical protein